MPVLKADIRALNSYIQDHHECTVCISQPLRAPVQHSYQSSETQQKPTQMFLFYFLTHTHLSYICWCAWKDWKEKELKVVLSLFFPIIIFSVNGWLTQGSNTQLERIWPRFFGGLCFFEGHCLPSALKASSHSKRKHGPLGPSAPLLSHTYSRFTLYLFWVSLNLSTSWGSLGFCECQMQGGSKEWHITCAPLSTCMLHRPMGLHLQYTSSKIKYIRICKHQDSWALNQAQTPFEHGVLCNCTGHTTIKLVLVPWYNVMENSW